MRKKQQVGAFYGNKEQHKKSWTMVQEAKEAVIEAGGNPTKKGIARDTGLALNTVKKHWEGSPVSPSEAKLRHVSEENIEYLPAARENVKKEDEISVPEERDSDQIPFDFFRGQNAPIRIGKALAKPESNKSPPSYLEELVSTDLNVGEVFEQLGSCVTEYSDSEICDFDFPGNRGGQNAIEVAEEGGQNSLPGALNADIQNFLNTGSDLEDLLGSMINDEEDLSED